jgi:hypothetical protein
LGFVGRGIRQVRCEGGVTGWRWSDFFACAGLTAVIGLFFVSYVMIWRGCR